MTETERETDRQADRDRDKERQRQTDRQTDRQTKRQTDRQADRKRQGQGQKQSERQTERDRESRVTGYSESQIDFVGYQSGLHQIHIIIIYIGTRTDVSEWEGAVTLTTGRHWTTND